MKAVVLLFGVLPVGLAAQGAVQLPGLTIHSPRVANQAPAGTFAMPVTALRYEPRVDVHGRNLAEGQADITLRGGIFETTGYQLGVLTIADPQTGHYLVELPVAPALLTAPEIATGSRLILGAANATTGAVSQRWRPVRTGGFVAGGLGEFGFRRGELHQGFLSAANAGGRRFGVDVALARSESDGAVRYGEHEFERGNLRLQTSDRGSQTDLFAGYQGKRFGWPNLYTPFNSNETENLQTSLFVLNHRADFGAGEFIEAGVYHRRNKDDYAFNRFAPLGPVHPFQHTTWVSGMALGGRRVWGATALNVRAEALADELESTSLTFGRYRSRTLTRVALVPERTWAAADGSRTIVKAGLAHDGSNRDGGAFSPVLELAREFASAGLRRVHVGYAKTTQLASYTALNSNSAAGLFRGNRNLGRHRAHTVEVGIEGQVAGWLVETGVFGRRDDALVDWTFRRGVTARTANAVDLDVAGLELVARRSWAAADVVVGYTALAKSSDYRGAPVDASFYALNYARHRLTAALTVRLGQGLELRLDHAARVQADNSLRLIGGDEAVAGAAGLSYRPPGRPEIELSLYVDNLWNSSYQDVPAVPAAPRQCSAGVSYAW
ncbi:MAG: TonB-dependent receptor [Opitutaceae bacterium]|nr:TonB-dependent receptor [Opitutaceae bacterium]